MKVRPTSRYIFTILLSISISSLWAQKKPDEGEYTRGFRIGYDVSRLALNTFITGTTPKAERNAHEISFDTEWKANYFAVMELGVESVKAKLSENELTLFDYKSTGYYGRIGFDHNILRRDDPSRRDIVYTGLRYGFYSITQETSNYSIVDGFWGNVTSSVPRETLTGHWLEIVFGAKVEIVKNLFVGASSRVRFRVYTTDALNYPMYMPGYGNGSKKVNMGINYYLSYQIPLMKVKAKEVPKAKK
jgi:hypothetical protein